MTDDLTQPDPHEEFVALYVEHQVAIRSFVRTLLPDPADAEDVMQTASMTMWRRFEQFQPGTSFRNWAFQVAKFVAMKHVARKTRDRLRFSEATIKMLAEHVEQQDERLAVQRRAMEHCVEQLGGAAFLEDQGPGQPQGSGTDNRQIVDRSADRQVAQIAAGEHRRIDDETIGRQRRAARR